MGLSDCQKLLLKHVTLVIEFVYSVDRLVICDLIPFSWKLKVIIKMIQPNTAKTDQSTIGLCDDLHDHK